MDTISYGSGLADIMRLGHDEFRKRNYRAIPENAAQLIYPVLSGLNDSKKFARDYPDYATNLEAFFNLMERCGYGK